MTGSYQCRPHCWKSYRPTFSILSRAVPSAESMLLDLYENCLSKQPTRPSPPIKDFWVVFGLHYGNKQNRCSRLTTSRIFSSISNTLQSCCKENRDDRWGAWPANNVKKNSHAMARKWESIGFGMIKWENWEEPKTAFRFQMHLLLCASSLNLREAIISKRPAWFRQFNWNVNTIATLIQQQYQRDTAWNNWGIHAMMFKEESSKSCPDFPGVCSASRGGKRGG